MNYELLDLCFPSPFPLFFLNPKELLFLVYDMSYENWTFPPLSPLGGGSFEKIGIQSL